MIFDELIWFVFFAELQGNKFVIVCVQSFLFGKISFNNSPLSSQICHFYIIQIDLVLSLDAFLRFAHPFDLLILTLYIGWCWMLWRVFNLLFFWFLKASWRCLLLLEWLLWSVFEDVGWDFCRQFKVFYKNRWGHSGRNAVLGFKLAVRALILFFLTWAAFTYPVRRSIGHRYCWCRGSDI